MTESRGAADHTDRLRTTLAGVHAAVTELGESRSCIEVSVARDLVAKA